MAIRKRAAVFGFGVAAVAGLSSGAVSWACTAQNTLLASVVSGAPRSHVAVSGTVVTATASAPVEIRWGSLTGPTLATVSPDGGGFSANVTIPEAPAGVSYLVATSGARRLASVAFQVLPTGGAESASAPALTDFWPKIDPSAAVSSHHRAANHDGPSLAIGAGLVSASALALAALGFAALRSRKAAVARR